MLLVRDETAAETCQDPVSCMRTTQTCTLSCYARSMRLEHTRCTTSLLIRSGQLATVRTPGRHVRRPLVLRLKGWQHDDGRTSGQADELAELRTALLSGSSSMQGPKRSRVTRTVSCDKASILTRHGDQTEMLYSMTTASCIRTSTNATCSTNEKTARDRWSNMHVHWSGWNAVTYSDTPVGVSGNSAQLAADQHVQVQRQHQRRGGQEERRVAQRVDGEQGRHLQHKPVLVAQSQP